MEFLDPLRLQSRPAVYRQLLSNPQAAHAVNAAFVQRVARGEADPGDDPLSLSPEELRLNEGFLTQQQHSEDVPTTSAWQED